MLSRRPRTAGLVAAAALTTLAAAPAYAGAATGGATTIDLKGAVARSLSSQQVRLAAQKPAKATAKRITLPVSSGTVATGATLRHGGSVTFRTRVRGRTRSAKLTAWETRVGASRSSVSAKLGAKRVTLFTIAAPKRRVAIDKSAGTARLTGGSVRLTAAGATALRTKLALRRLAAGPLGSAKVSASVGAEQRRGGGTPTNPGGPTTPGPGPTTPGPTTPPVDKCQGFETKPVPVASDPLPRIGATPLAATTFVWEAKDSWIRYINTPSGAGQGVTLSNGASGSREVLPGSSAPLIYRFRFEPDLSRSWYDAGSSTGVLYHRGTVRFLWIEHMLDITLKDPEVELNGARSRIVFRVSGSDCSRISERRVDLLSFAASGSPTPGPLTAATRIMDPGASVFSGIYPTNSDWGAVSYGVTP